MKANGAVDNELGQCRLAALAYGLRLINEYQRDRGELDYSSDVFCNHHKRQTLGDLVQFVIDKGDEIHKATGYLQPTKFGRSWRTHPNLARIKADEVAAMHARYVAGESLSSIGRARGTSHSPVRDVFRSRGLPVRAHSGPEHNAKNGRFLPVARKSDAEISKIFASMKRIAIPEPLRLEWRKLSLKRRAKFVRELRARLQSPNDAPTTPYSSNVKPFDYGSWPAHRIMNAINAGLGSRSFKMKVDLVSQGVIYKGQLWFWCPKTGYQRGPWTKEHGRPLLHRVIWEEHFGPIPPKHLVFFKDGNRNNFNAFNLGLRSMKDNVRLNSKGWTINHKKGVKHDTGSVLRDSKYGRRLRVGDTTRSGANPENRPAHRRVAVAVQDAGLLPKRQNGEDRAGLDHVPVGAAPSRLELLKQRWALLE